MMYHIYIYIYLFIYIIDMLYLYTHFFDRQIATTSYYFKAGKRTSTATWRYFRKYKQLSMTCGKVYDISHRIHVCHIW